jgi:invasion protein IalB
MSLKSHAPPFALIVAVATFLCSGAFAQDEGPADSPPDAAATEAPKIAWPVTCRSREGQEKLTCSMSQVIATKKTGQRVIAVTALRDKKGEALLRLNLPHGLLLPKGVSISIDAGEPKKYAILTADKNGSYAFIKLDDKIIAALKGGKELNITVVRFSGGDVVFKLPLEGFAAGFAKL